MGRIKRNRNLGWLVICISLFMLGCLCLPPNLLITATVTPQAPELPTATQAPLQPTPAPSANNLNAEGPWLLIETQQGLWAMNPDGSGLAQLTNVDYWHGSLRNAVQPGGNQIAFISPGDYSFSHMALNLLLLPQGNIIKVTDLTSAQTEAYSSSAPGDPGFETLRAIGEQESFAWSADGNALAFIGAMEGPTADLYVYYTRTGAQNRITRDDGQDFAPSWSPDGSTILYQEAEGFGTGAGITLDGIFRVPMTGGDPEMISGKGSGGEIVGWLDNDTALLDDWSISCGPSNLRLYKLSSGAVTPLRAGCISSAAASPSRAAAMFSDDAGLYMLVAGDPAIQQVSTEANSFIVPMSASDQVFRVYSQVGMLSTYGTSDVDHQLSPVTQLADSWSYRDNQDVAEYGAIWGWTSSDTAQPGAWITGPGLEIGQVFTGPARFPAWDYHNNLVFFAMVGQDSYDVYRTTFDAYYKDLNKVNHLDANILNVILAGPGPY